MLSGLCCAAWTSRIGRSIRDSLTWMRGSRTMNWRRGLQITATDALDLSQESEQTKEMYGLNQEITASYGRRCLMARRLVERGVRFVQIYIEGQIWDAHSDLENSLRYSCGKTDKPAAALLRDLKQRGLLDSTLVIWGGEFGRMPLSQVRDNT